MAHAEVEAYLEERSLEIANAAAVAWRTQRRVSLTTLSLLGFCGHHLSTPPDTLMAPGQNQEKSWPDKIQIENRLKNAIDTYVKYVRMDNHGIRERQLMAMLIPLGIAPSDIDPLAVAEIDNFGHQRGETAHSSAAGKITIGIDPKAEFEAVQKIIRHLGLIDILFDGLQTAEPMEA
ncbi:hypothetical protein NED98_18395 [Sphingomonas sp. MMSM20]|nr:hypothetical protein [Sphingomonas lycopersici]